MTQNIVCFGEVLLRLTPPGKQLLLQQGQFEAYVGGAEANVAVSMSRLGHTSSMVTSLPDNPLGHACVSELRRQGVRTDAVEFRDGRMGLYFMTQGAGQRPSEVLYDRAHSAFATAPADLHDWDALLSNAEWLHVSGITPAVSANAAAAAARAMASARANKVKISFDCNFRARLWGARAPEAPQLLRALCEQADLIFGDDRDVAFMLGFDAGTGSATDRRRNAAAAAFKAFGSLQWLAYTERSLHSVDTQQLAGTLHSASEVFTTVPTHCTASSTASAPAMHRRRHSAWPDRRQVPASHGGLRNGRRLPETYGPGRLQCAERRRHRVAVVGRARGRQQIARTEEVARITKQRLRACADAARA